MLSAAFSSRNRVCLWPGKAVVCGALALFLCAATGWPQQTGDQGTQQPSQPSGQQAGQQPTGTQPTGNQSNPPGVQLPLGPENPIGAAGQPATSSQVTTPPGQQMDTRPLTGAQELTAILPGGGRSYAIPSFSVWEGADSDAQLAPGVTKYEGATIPLGSLDLNYMTKSNQFSLVGSGGGIIYDSDSSYNSSFGSLAISDAYTARRWNFLLMDSAMYLPQASEGFGGIGFAGIFNAAQSLGLGEGLGQINQAYAPGQSILLGRFGTSTNNVVGQFQYNLTERTSFSAVGSFGIQHYAETGFSSSNDFLYVFALDHHLNATDTVSLSYTLIQYRYSGGTVAVNDNVWQAGYGHRVTDRLIISVVGGPAVVYSAIRGISGTQEKTTWEGQAKVNYQAERGGIYLSYLHYITPGSGFFEGANTDTATLGVSRDLTRTWTGSFNLGYTRNTELGTFSAATNPGPINYEFGSLRLSHTMGRHMKAFAVYELEHQLSGAALLPDTGQTKIFRQIFGVGIQFQPGPYGL